MINRYFSDKIEEFNLSLSSVVLAGEDWKLIIRHEVEDYTENYSSTIYLNMIIKREKRVFERTAFELLYYENSFNEATFISYEYPETNTELLGRLTVVELKKMLMAGNSSYLLPLSEYSAIITCPAIPVEVRQWLLMNCIKEMAPDLKKTRNLLKKKVMAATKIALKE